ncbi:MAG: response regulator transcription factor [Lentisphaeria bacterium]|nr:response regulator transcription factor [Lentisphaeria bacterium]
MKILVIEDDKKTADFLLRALADAGYETCYAADGAQGLELGLSEDFACGIVDIMLPEIDGFTVIEKLRAAGKNVPLIVLSAKSSLDDKVHGLHAGADCYLAKPFSVAELLANIQAQLRRVSLSAEPTVLTVEDLEINIITRKVTRAGKLIDLPPLEYDLLEYLVRNAHRVVTRSMLMENVWEYSFDPSTNIVETRVCKLREKIDKPFGKELIHTVRGIGYVLE